MTPPRPDYFPFSVYTHTHTHTHTMNAPLSGPRFIASSFFSVFSRYFEDDEEEAGSGVDLPYIPAENSPTRQQMQAGGSDSEDDPLDAFMAEVEVRLEADAETRRSLSLFVFFRSDGLNSGLLSLLFQSQAAKDMRKLEEKEKEKNADK